MLHKLKLSLTDHCLILGIAWFPPIESKSERSRLRHFADVDIRATNFIEMVHMLK